jgi:hypothetical protein
MIFTISVPRNSAFTPETQVLYILTLRKFLNCSKTIQTIIFCNGVEWMHLVQNHSHNFGTPKYYIQDRNTCLLSFYNMKVFKLLENNPNHYFLCNGVEWMHLVRNYSHNFGTPKNYIQDPNTSFASFHVRQVYKVLQTTRKHNFGTNGVEWMDLLWNNFHNFGTPK